MFKSSTCSSDARPTLTSIHQRCEYKSRTALGLLTPSARLQLQASHPPGTLDANNVAITDSSADCRALIRAVHRLNPLNGLSAASSFEVLVTVRTPCVVL